MKMPLSLLLFLALGRAFGQFIPQPMGYNPDENGDAFISVTDLQGMLALYGNAFDNGDSLVVESWTFPEDYPTPPTAEDNLNGYPVNVHIDEEFDFLYINQLVDRNVNFWLPQGDGFHVLQVFLSCEGFNNWPVEFFGVDGDPNSYMNGGTAYIYEGRPKTFTFIRGHDGRWYD